MVDINELIRKQTFVSELERVLTPVNIRRTLEKKFGLEENILDEKPSKKRLKTMIDKIFMDTYHDDDSVDKTQIDASKEDTMQEIQNEESEMSELESVEPKKKAKKANINTKTGSKTGSRKNGVKSSKSKEKGVKTSSEDESEMSELDISPPKKKQKGTKKASAVVTTKEDSDDETETSQLKKAAGTKEKSTAAVSPNEEKIKRLKQYVSKCGVRKQWAKEFSNCTSPKQQIKRLQEILVELGVEGRPTIEKCEKIKAQREIQDELASLDTQNILNDDKGVHTRGRRVRKPRKIVGEDDEENEDGEEDEESKKSTGFDISFLGDQSSDSE
ncbi:hypothetical protein F4703DRAFT_1922200 [Phycomyces blakesleeanus]